MRLILLLSILTFLFNSLASPHPPSPVLPRQAESSSVEPHTAAIATTITLVNGTDISSAFQTFLYQSPTQAAPSNLTDRDLVDRQNQDFIRSIDSCKRRLATFVSSECDFNSNLKHSLGRFKVRCRLVSRNSERTSFIIEQGVCHADEICVNGPLDRRGRPTVASCVGRQRFEPLSNYNTPEGKARIEKSLKGSTASALVSQPNGQTAMSVESLKIDAAVVGGTQVGPTSHTTCTDCAEVATGKLGEGTDFLSTEVTVNMAGMVATAGILWLAILSG